MTDLQAAITAAEQSSLEAHAALLQLDAAVGQLRHRAQEAELVAYERRVLDDATLMRGETHSVHHEVLANALTLVKP